MSAEILDYFLHFQEIIRSACNQAYLNTIGINISHHKVLHFTFSTIQYNRMAACVLLLPQYTRHGIVFMRIIPKQASLKVWLTDCSDYYSVRESLLDRRFSDFREIDEDHND